MSETTIGILHPGAMGSSLAGAARAGAATVLWASDGRGAQSVARAEAAGLEDAGTLASLAGRSDVIVSVCPPHAAEALAQTVLATGYSGLFVDANAVAPARARRIAAAVQAAGAGYVDGGIIGPPPERAGTTCLYLSGAEAPKVAQLFQGSALAAEALDETPDRASALKMCYAAQTKGLTALLCAQLAAAEALGVRDALQARWRQEDAEAPERAIGRVRNVTAKAWRFSGEMEEIAATLQAAGLPDGFHRAAAEIYGRLAEFKTAADLPEIEAVLEALTAESSEAARRAATSGG